MSAQEGIEQSLYAKRQKIYPREVHGLFALMRLSAMAVLLGGYYLAAWFQIDGRQALLFDLPARKFYILWWTFWPQDAFYLAGLLILAALSLFFFTALAGRLWCGYACPQTVWTEMFLWIERKIEGDRLKQMKLDKAPWTARKLAIKGAKHGAWVLVALWTGFTFVGYFSPIRELWTSVISLSTGPWETFWILFYGFATWGNAGFMREQVCIYMCPYARFQSAMFDRNTLIISYDAARGDPRGARKRGADKEARGLGDCVDCSICVQVCPTGIDIRNGLQYQCIGCAACVDACDDVMQKVGYPKGLVRYTTLNALDGKSTRVLRPRVFAYAGLLLAIGIALLYAIVHRVPLDVDVIRDRNVLFRETDDGLLENIYTLKLINMGETARDFNLSVRGIEGLAMSLTHGKDRAEAVHLEAGEVRNLGVRLTARPEHVKARSTEVIFRLAAKDGEPLVVEEDARFLGPQPK